MHARGNIWKPYQCFAAATFVLIQDQSRKLHKKEKKCHHFNLVLLSGAPNDCFLYNICSEKQKLPEIFYYLGTATNF